MDGVHLKVLIWSIDTYTYGNPIWNSSFTSLQHSYKINDVEVHKENYYPYRNKPFIKRAASIKVNITFPKHLLLGSGYGFQRYT